MQKFRFDTPREEETRDLIFATKILFEMTFVLDEK